MIDLRRLREDAEYRAGIERKRVAPGLIAEVLAVDAEARAQRQAVEGLRARQKQASKAVGRGGADAEGARVEAGRLKEELQRAEQELAVLERRQRDLAVRLPNPADVSVPDGGEDDAEVLRVVGEPTPAPPLDHAALAEAMGFVETRHTVEASGSRFVTLLGAAALLELALVRWAVDRVV
ncbi:MAG TPA: serine--tRNA ligase, partial [Acidimicrobiia bacterium]|nr:serine--tRNA ligase [Acidimicrobiia bacterium]